MDIAFHTTAVPDNTPANIRTIGLCFINYFIGNLPNTKLSLPRAPIAVPSVSSIGSPEIENDT